MPPPVVTAQWDRLRVRIMEHLDLDSFTQELSDKSVNLLPDGTTCYAARYFASKNQAWFCVGLVAVSPVVVVSLTFAYLVSTCLSIFFFLVAVLGVWHLLRYRRYQKEIRAGCHMHGVFLFAATRDVVVRFHHAVGGDVEASFARDNVLAVTVQSRCCQPCVVIDGTTSSVVIPASWLCDPPRLVATAVDRHLAIEF